MMRCRRIKPLISQFIDQTLPPPQARQVERHLAECPECAAFQREFAGVVDLLRASPPQRAPGDFTAKVMRRVCAEKGQRSLQARPRWWEMLRLTPRWVAAGSLAVLLVVATFCLWPAPGTRIGPETQSFVEECMTDYELYASARPAVEKTPFLMGSWGN